jgi:hypothetical protein
VFDAGLNRLKELSIVLLFKLLVDSRLDGF